MKERPLTFYLAKPRQKITAILKNYVPFIYGDIHYITLLIHFATSRALNTQRNTTLHYVTSRSLYTQRNTTLHYVTSRSLYTQRNSEACSCNHRRSGKAISITCSECVFVALGIHHTGRMRHIVNCSLAALKHLSTLPHKRSDFQTQLLNTKRVFPLQILFEVLLILRRIE